MKCKTICDEIAAIGMSHMEDRESVWMLNGLGAIYQMFTTMTLQPPLHEYTELLSMLQNYETRILLQDFNKVTQQVAFTAHKQSKGKANAPKLT